MNLTVATLGLMAFMIFAARAIADTPAPQHACVSFSTAAPNKGDYHGSCQEESR